MSGWYFDFYQGVESIKSACTEMVIVDDHIWITDGTSISVWNVWGSKDKDELATDELQDVERNVKTELMIGWFRTPTLVFSETITGGVYKMAKAHDRVYFMNSAQTEIKYLKTDFSNYDDLSSQYPIRITVNVDNLGDGNNLVINSDLLFAYDKLWMVSDYHNTKKQYLISIDLNTPLFDNTLVDIPAKKQREINKLVDGQNGFVYVARYQQGVISKFAGSNAAFISNIQVNAKPTSFNMSSDGYLMIGSYNGLISYLNRTNDAITHPYGVIAQPSSIVDMNDGYIWMTTGTLNGLLRLKKSDQKVIYTWCPPDTSIASMQAELEILQEELTTLTEAAAITAKQKQISDKQAAITAKQKDKAALTPSTFLLIYY